MARRDTVSTCDAYSVVGGYQQSRRYAAKPAPPPAPPPSPPPPPPPAPPPLPPPFRDECLCEGKGTGPCATSMSRVEREREAPAACVSELVRPGVVCGDVVFETPLARDTCTALIHRTGGTLASSKTHLIAYIAVRHT